jgi:hypothetical protein
MNATIVAPAPTRTPRAPQRIGVPSPPPRKRKGPWALGLGTVVLLIVLPIVILAGAANPPGCTTGSTGGGAVSGSGGTPQGGHFAAALHMAPGTWYRIGATEYGPPGTGDYGSDPDPGQSDLATHPDSFAELSTLDYNPANVPGDAFTFADADALGNLPYGTNLRVKGPSGRELVLAKRDTGFGQGPDGQTGGVIYRIDVWNGVSAQLGISKSPVSIELAPTSGTSPTLGDGPPTATPPASTPIATVNSGADQATGYVDALHSPQRAGFAVVSADGTVIAHHNANMPVPGGSITTAMLLIAYLRMVGHRPLPAAAKPRLAALIDNDDDQPANWTFAQVGAGRVQTVAADAGMTNFKLTTANAGYALSSSRVTALDQARLFAKIDQLIPAAHRGYALKLLSHIAGADHWGILQATLTAATITASTAGTTRVDRRWVVNQAAQLNLGTAVVGIAATSQGDPTHAAGETVMRAVASDLDPQAVAGAGCVAATLTGGPLRLTPGQTAQIDPRTGAASAPEDAPRPVKLAIAAANEIRTKPYPPVEEHYFDQYLGKPWPAYDCSGSTSYVLWKAGLRGIYATNSTGLESYGEPGPGKWITVYANSGHVWTVIAGRAFDTANFGGPNLPDGSGPRWRTNPAGNLADGSQYVVRHPAGAWNE